MPVDDTMALLRRLCLAAGPPGGEDEVRGVVRDALQSAGTIAYDRLGSILCERRGSRDTPRIMLDSHLDEVAFMVQSVTEDGNLAFVTLGGWWGHVLLGQRVEVLTENDRIHGVIGCKPPHFLTDKEKNQVLAPEAMYIDVGASDRAQVETLGVRVGDMAVPYTEFRELAIDGAVSCKALDNRIGVSLMCEAMTALADREHPNTVIGVGAVQEEIGSRGAGTASEVARPDVGLVLECTPADDLPGVTERQAVLGGGPQIRYFDPTAVSNRRLLRCVQEVAEKCRVTVQMAVRRTGGTDAASIHRHGAGVPTVVIGVPARYIHSHVGLMQWRDYEAAKKLVVELLAYLDAERVAGLTSYE